MKLLIAILILVACGISNAYATEHTAWPMFKHDPQHTSQSPFNGIDENTLKWKFSTGDRIQSSPSIDSDGTIYVGSFDGNLYAINPDGTEKWRFSGGLVDSTPAISSDGTIYFGSWDKNLYAVDPAGKGKWRAQTSDQVSSSPTIGPDGTIYIGADDGFLYAIRPDRTLEWSFRTGDRIISTATIGPDGTIYVGSFDGNLYAINPDGTEKWRFVTGGFVFSSATISNDGTVYFGSYDENVYAFYPNGTLRWVFPAKGIVQGSPSIGSDGTIYVGSFDGNLYAINPDGTEKWRFKTGDLVVSSAAIDSDGTIYVGSVDTFLYAINPNGTEKWRFKTDARIFSSPAIAPDGTIYVGSVDGNLYAIGRPSEPSSSIQARDGKMQELLGHAGSEMYVASASLQEEKEGNRLSVEVLLKNVDSLPRNFDTTWFKLKDASGNEYVPSLEKSTLRSVRIESGDVTRAIIVFESLPNLSSALLVYNDIRGAKITVDLFDIKTPPDPRPIALLVPGSNIGKKIIGELLELTILDEKFLQSDPQQYVVRVSLKNRLTEDIPYDQSFVYVKDGEGNVYLPVTEGTSFNGVLGPDESVAGDILFLLPAEVSGVVFVYDDMATGSFFVVPEFPLTMFATAAAILVSVASYRLKDFIKKVCKVTSSSSSGQVFS